jgi:hypothetical protein
MAVPLPIPQRAALFAARPHGAEREAILTVYQPYRVTLRRVHWYEPNDL